MSTVSASAAPSLLAAIVAGTTRAVEVRAAAKPIGVIEREIVRQPRADLFADALRRSPFPRVIAECKRRSPSRGILRAAYDPVGLASAYANAGAAAISVLTEPAFFDGSPVHLRAVRGAVGVPLLRKDFIVTEYQLVEAAALGADAALLIVGALDDRLLQWLIERCSELHLAALVEVHDEDELQRALDAKASIVGVNSRDLRTLAVDPGVLERLAAAIPDGVIAVAESGLRNPDELRRLGDAGYDAFLVGERLVTSPDPAAALRELRGT